MGDPNRPVTGYPASNHNPHSANPPPSATAGPPFNHPYYNYHNNPYYYQNYQPDPDSVRRANCLRRIFALVIGLVVIFGAITFIVWLVLRPQLPEFRVDSFSLSNFTFTNNSFVSLKSEIQFTARNPNKKMTLVYDDVETAIFYKAESISMTTLSPFSQDTKNETSLLAKFAAAERFVDKSAVDGINGEIGKNGNIGFNVRILSSVRFEAKAWKTRRRFLKVFCGDLTVEVPGNGRSGQLTGGTRQCRVGL